MNSPLVSIIIPFYNSEPFIVETINSALNQTYKNIEIIIVDDGSTDNSLSLAKELQSDKLKVFSQENKGASAARNFGLREAKGDYIQFLDADDLLAANKIAEQINILKQHPNAIASGSFIKFKTHISNTIGPKGPHTSIARDLKPLDWLVINHTMLVHAWLCPKHIIEKAGLWNEQLSLNDDGEYFARVVSEADKIIFCKSAMVYYRTENANSISQENSAIKLRSAVIAASGIEKSIFKLAKDDNLNAKKTIGNIYKQILFVTYIEYPEIYNEIKKHWSIKYAEKQYNPGGKISTVLNKIFGWKSVAYLKKIKIIVKCNYGNA